MSEKMREEFEAKFPTPLGIWWSAESGEDGGRYMTEFAHVGCVYHQGRWEGWKASRESLAIDLSDLSNCFSPNDCGDWAMWLDDVRILVQRAGLKVKV